MVGTLAALKRYESSLLRVNAWHDAWPWAIATTDLSLRVSASTIGCHHEGVLSWDAEAKKASRSGTPLPCFGNPYSKPTSVRLLLPALEPPGVAIHFTVHVLTTVIDRDALDAWDC
jgi:hypothetical protein